VIPDKDEVSEWPLSEGGAAAPSGSGLSQI
jgi:hypothetical protein